MTDTEKRRFIRIPIAKQLRIRINSVSDLFARLKGNISLGGMLFETDKPLPVGARLSIQIEVTHGPTVSLAGTVVRVDSAPQATRPGMAVEFDPPKEGERHALEKLLELSAVGLG